MRKTQLLLALSAIGFAGSAFATNGMNLEGYGPIATGMGGASMAYDNGTAAVMNNPATLGLGAQGNRLDLAIGMLGPDVSSSAGPFTASSGGDSYLMPAIGWTKKDGALTYGAALFAQGGMGTEYSATSFLSAGSGLAPRSELGVGRLIAPLAFEMNDKLTIGGSLDFVWAMMDLKMAMSGQQFFDMMGMPAAMGGIGAGHTYGEVSGGMMGAFQDYMQGTNLSGRNPTSAIAFTGVNWGSFDFSDDNKYTGKTKATGWAGKIGFTYKVSPALTLGGTYHSQTSLGDMEGDATVSFNVPLSAGFGGGSTTIPLSGKIKVVDFQWPETIGFGMAYQANDKLMIAADYKRINWADVMKNFKMTFTADATQPGMAAAFGGLSMDATMKQNWKDQDVIQVGISYKVSEPLTLRAGVNVANNPIPDTFMNPLFPAIEKSHYTLGVGYAMSKVSDVNMSIQHAPSVSQTNGQGVTTEHSQTSWQLMYSKRF
jgi:long-chain fatty acid transport protein